MRLQELLRTKGPSVHTISPAVTLAEAVAALVGHHCGSLVVCDPPSDRRRMVGIISERDILRAAADRGDTFGRARVDDYMTRQVVTLSPVDEVERAMSVMTERRVRHLPILEDNELVGIISIGDLVKTQLDAAMVENHYLKSYIQS